ncbi:putative peptidase [unidentified eubacterium SCB49]|nr:putative peptidase [unidentified eubacterium SCB49]
MAEKEKRGKKFRKKLLHTYRLVVLNENTFEERFSFKLNRLNVFVFGILSALFLIGITTIIIAFTPLREYIPGYSSTSLKKQATSLQFQADSLRQEVKINQEYISSIRKVLSGDVKTVTFNKDSIVAAAEIEADDVDLHASQRDLALRERVDQEDKYNPLTANTLENFAFSTPVKGTISEGFKPEIKHYAVDVVTVKGAPIKAAADGTVIFAEWTSDTGYVILLKHASNFISVYKHNASLLKTQGELVKAGEVIAIAGNTGNLSTGPHLHFELWMDGVPMNPTNFIDFE